MPLPANSRSNANSARRVWYLAVTTITDFHPGTDNIGLYASVFTQAGAAGLLAPEAFSTGSAARDATDRIINALAAVLFIYNGLVVWQDAFVMMGGAILGGIGGAGLARRAGRTAVRRTVIVVGFLMAFKTMWDAFGS